MLLCLVINQYQSHLERKRDEILMKNKKINTQCVSGCLLLTTTTQYMKKRQSCVATMMLMLTGEINPSKSSKNKETVKYITLLHNTHTYTHS